MLQSTIAHLEVEVFATLRRLGFSYPEHVNVASFDYVNKPLSSYYQNVFSGLMSWRRDTTQLGDYSVFISELLNNHFAKPSFRIMETETNAVQFLIAKQLDDFRIIILKKNGRERLLAVRKQDFKNGKVAHYDKSFSLKVVAKSKFSESGFALFDKPAMHEVKSLLTLKKPRIPAVDAVVARGVFHAATRSAIKAVD